MGIFKNFFANVKSTTIKSIVAMKLNKLIDNIRYSKTPVNSIVEAAFKVYGKSINKSVDAIIKIIDVNKNDISTLIANNYDAVLSIISAFNKINTTDNRSTLKTILERSYEIIKCVDNDMQKEFEEDYLPAVNSQIITLNKVWMDTTNKTVALIHREDINPSNIGYLTDTYGARATTDILDILNNNPAVDYVRVITDKVSGKVVQLQGGYKRMVKI